MNRAEPGLGDRLFAETPITGARYLIEHYHLPMTVEEVSAGIIIAGGYPRSVFPIIILVKAHHQEAYR